MANNNYKKPYNKQAATTNNSKPQQQRQGGGKDDFVPTSPEARLTCSHDGAEELTNLSGLWFTKAKNGDMYFRGKDRESGTTYQVWVNDEEMKKLLEKA